jgi:ATP-dependent Lon protease
VVALVNRSLDLIDVRLRQDQPVPLDLIRQLASGGQAQSETRVEDCIRELKRIKNPSRFADLIAALLLPNPAARQMILETVQPEARLRHLVLFLAAEIHRGASGEGEG